MDASVIDTLRYASRLKAAGVEPQQAEAMSRALNDEIGGGVATKGDLDHAVDGVTGEIVRVERELTGEVGRVELELKGEIVRVEGEVTREFGRVEGELTREIGRVERELKGDIARLESGLASLESEVKENIGLLDGRLVGVEGEFKRLDGRINTLAAKFDTQGRYVFLVLALIAAFGLYNVMFPPLATRLSQTADVQAAAPAPAEAPGPMEQQPSVHP